RKVLAEKGMDKNTVIILMGDNGYFLGERQLAGKWLMYDNSFRVPLLVFDPRTAGGKRESGFALNIDVAATILELAGAKIPKVYQGLSLQSSALGKRNEVLIEHLWQTPIIAPSEAIRTERWKYFRYINEPEWEELYDLNVDPLEQSNLANNPAFQTDLAKLRKKMEAQIEAFLKERKKLLPEDSQ
ncbi:MAG: DUF4976 domain-containing protein, partial [Cytophagales bacterium]